MRYFRLVLERFFAQEREETSLWPPNMDSSKYVGVPTAPTLCSFDNLSLNTNSLA